MSITKLQIICSVFNVLILLVNVQSTSSQLDSLLHLLSPCYIHFINQNLLPSNTNKLSPSSSSISSPPRSSYSQSYFFSKLFVSKTPLMIHVSSKNIISPNYLYFHSNFTLQNQNSPLPLLPSQLPPIKFPFTSGCEIRLIPISPRTFSSLQLSVYFKQNPKYVILLQRMVMIDSRPPESDSTISKSTLSKQTASQQTTATRLYKSLHKIASSTCFFTVLLNSNLIQHPNNSLYMVNMIFGGLMSSQGEEEEMTEHNSIPLLIPIPNAKMLSLKELLQFWAQNHQNFHLSLFCCQAWEVDEILDELSIRLNFTRQYVLNEDDDEDDKEEDEVATVHVWRRHMPTYYLEGNFINHTVNQYIWLSHAPMYNYFTFVVFANQLQYDSFGPIRPFDLSSWVAIFVSIPFVAIVVSLTLKYDRHQTNDCHTTHHHHHTFTRLFQPFLFYSPKPKPIIETYTNSSKSSKCLGAFCFNTITSFIPSIFWTFGLLLDISEGHVGTKLCSRPRFWLGAWLLPAIVLSYGYKGCILSFMTRINYPVVPKTLRDLDNSNLIILSMLTDLKDDLPHIIKYQNYLGQQVKQIQARICVTLYDMHNFLATNFSQAKLIEYVASKEVNLVSPRKPPKAQPFVMFDRENIVRKWIAVLTFFTNYYVISNEDRLVRDIFTRHPWIAIRNFFIPIFTRLLSGYHEAGIIDMKEQILQDKIDAHMLKSYRKPSDIHRLSPFAFFALCRAKKVEALPQPVPISLGRVLIFIFFFLSLISLCIFILCAEIICYKMFPNEHSRGSGQCHANNNDIISVQSSKSSGSAVFLI